MTVRGSKTVFQNAFIVNDLEEGIAHWVRHMGIGPFIILDNIDLADATYRGQPTELKMHAALAMSGDLQMELIQPLHSHASVYRDFYPDGQEGFHHIGVLTDDVDRDVETYTRLGHEVVATGGARDGTHIAYVDTWSAANCLVELINADQGFMEMTRMLGDAARNWDGKTLTITL
jgi:hypothetical protein